MLLHTPGQASLVWSQAKRTEAASRSRGSLDDLKIVPGRAVMLAANAVSTETVH